MISLLKLVLYKDIYSGWYFNKAGNLLINSLKSHVAVRSSHQRCSKKKVFLKMQQNSQENICARFLRTPFLQNTSGRLLLNSSSLASIRRQFLFTKHLIAFFLGFVRIILTFLVLQSQDIQCIVFLPIKTSRDVLHNLENPIILYIYISYCYITPSAQQVLSSHKCRVQLNEEFFQGSQWWF